VFNKPLDAFLEKGWLQPLKSGAPLLPLNRWGIFGSLWKEQPLYSEAFEQPLYSETFEWSANMVLCAVQVILRRRRRCC
jgi:hypothetical protein